MATRRRPMGRPLSRSESISLTLGSDLKQTIARDSRRAGVSASDFVRDVLDLVDDERGLFELWLDAQMRARRRLAEGGAR